MKKGIIFFMIVLIPIALLSADIEFTSIGNHFDNIDVSSEYPSGFSSLNVIIELESPAKIKLKIDIASVSLGGNVFLRYDDSSTEHYLSLVRDGVTEYITPVVAQRLVFAVDGCSMSEGYKFIVSYEVLDDENTFNEDVIFNKNILVKKKLVLESGEGAWFGASPAGTIIGYDNSKNLSIKAINDVQVSSYQQGNVLLQPDPLNGYVFVGTKLGIGTRNPSQKLDVIGDSKLDGNVYLSPNNGNVGVGTSTPNYKFHVNGQSFISDKLIIGSSSTTTNLKLDVNGAIRANEVKVSLDSGADFVFEPDYKLMSIGELSRFVNQNKHLPDVAPAVVMEEEGLDLSQMNVLLLQKIEELTLYIIELNERIAVLEEK